MHDWPTQSRDVFKHNIVLTAYQPALMEGTSAVDGKWGKELDYNFFATDEESMRKYADYGTDTHSITGDPMFVNASEADFRIKEESPVWNIGFHNFDMHSFGVLSKRLKAIAKTPEIPALKMAVSVHEESKEVEWSCPLSGQWKCDVGFRSVLVGNSLGREVRCSRLKSRTYRTSGERLALGSEWGTHQADFPIGEM